MVSKSKDLPRQYGVTMSTFVRARSNSDSAPVAVILPGAGYTAMGPLLYWCGEMLSQEGWHVQGVEWAVDARALSHPQAFVEQAVAEAFDAAPQSSRRLIVAKSLGCFALPWARRNGLPGVWLTPVLTNVDVRQALIEASAADMAIGGEADTVWLPEAIADTRASVISVPKADHSLALPGDWRGSLAAQTAIFESIANHLRTT
ncbi:hypothetical protein E3T54_13125 [Cryobacterium sp. Sr8]|uniref:hypothetical protein n=1 Tax=Cryobacterium sp. Sr8 TaxID=1259203 RepID=UPI00106B0307|nr:hypothetical protein [Cryobacterium sp. Sr8]TFD74885.1 hypothetical protein E3T54_13125 [Cryobacterium sp. Sr8]